MTFAQIVNKFTCNVKNLLVYDKSMHYSNSTYYHTCVLFYAAAGATGISTTKIFPAPTRPLKTKRDPKKLRLAGGQVWEDHSLDDWDQSKSNLLLVCQHSMLSLVHVHLNKSVASAIWIRGSGPSRA